MQGRDISLIVENGGWGKIITSLRGERDSYSEIHSPTKNTFITIGKALSWTCIALCSTALYYTLLQCYRHANQVSEISSHAVITFMRQNRQVLWPHIEMCTVSWLGLQTSLSLPSILLSRYIRKLKTNRPYYIRLPTLNVKCEFVR